MYSMVMTAITCGLESVCIQVEADVSDGMPMFEMVGFLSLLLAIKHLSLLHDEGLLLCY